MSARQPHRALIYTATLAAITLVAGCATTISGSGHLAANATTTLPGQSPGLPTGGSTGFPNPGPTLFPSQPPISIPTSVPTAIPTEGGSQAPARKLCDVVSSAELQKIFGEPVTATPTRDTSCDFRTPHQLLIVSVSDQLTLALKKENSSGVKDLTIAGNPAASLENESEVVVALSKNPTGDGIVSAYNDLDSPISLSKITALLDKIVPAYPVS